MAYLFKYLNKKMHFPVFYLQYVLGVWPLSNFCILNPSELLVYLFDSWLKVFLYQRSQISFSDKSQFDLCSSNYWVFLKFEIGLWQGRKKYLIFWLEFCSQVDPFVHLSGVISNVLVYLQTLLYRFTKSFS